jgi:DNA-binding transcriptional LysR family regulator
LEYDDETTHPLGRLTIHRASLLELHAALAVATHRSFRRAAADIGMSTSALSYAISSLEEKIGIRLFNRSTRSVATTEAGERFIARLRPAIAEVTSAINDASATSDQPSGLLRINAPEGATRMILAPVILAFLDQYPAMEVEVVTEGKLVDIVAGGFDAGIRLAESAPQDMIAIACGPDQRFAVVGTPGYFAARGQPLAPDDLAQHRCIRHRFSSGSIFRWEFEKLGQVLAIDVAGPLTLDNPNLILDAVLSGGGLGYLIESSVEKYIKAGDLVRVLEDWTPAFSGPCLYYPSRRNMPNALRAFVDLLKEYQKSAA